jgi:predicted ATPase
VVHSNSQQSVLPEHLVQVIVDKADGNPFFLEELTRTVIEHERLQDEVSVPDTIQGVLMARIDRLPKDAKRLVQTAAVLGREFSPRLLEVIWDEDPALPPLLMEPKRREFLYERTEADASAEEVQYVPANRCTSQ